MRRPSESAAGKGFAQGGDHPSPTSLTPHFPGALNHRHQVAIPAPVVVSFASYGDHNIRYSL